MSRDRLGAIMLSCADDLTEAIFRLLKLPNWGVDGGHAGSLADLAIRQERPEFWAASAAQCTREAGGNADLVMRPMDGGQPVQAAAR